MRGCCVIVAMSGVAGTVCAQLDEPFPTVFELSSLDGTNGFAIKGIDPDDRSGWSVSSAGDVNADGIDDIVIGAPRAAPGGRVIAGETYVVFGRDTAAASGFPASVDLAMLDGTTGFVINGVDGRVDGLTAGDFSGVSVSSAGDINGDGIDDLVIGAVVEQSFGIGPGETYVVFGRDTGAAGGFPASLDLATLDGSNGFQINGDQPLDRSGWAVSAAGDINGDGIGDLVIGAFGAFGGAFFDTGERYIVFGRDTAAAGNFPPVLALAGLNGTDGFVLHGIDIGDRSGRAVASAGDVNGDGIDDLLIGAPTAAPGGRTTAGQSYVFFGRETAVSGSFAAVEDLGSLDGVDGFAINGVDPGDWSGISVSSAGDVNADGVVDLLIGAAFADIGGQELVGRTYVVFGRDASATGGFPAAVELSSLDGTNGYVINGISGGSFDGDRSGFSVSSAGDVNNDGTADLLIGAVAASPNGEFEAGESYVIFGGALVGASGVLELSSLDGENGFVLSGIDAGDNSGFSVSSAGDVNADGVTDLLIGAREADPNGDSDAGESYVVFGRDVPPPCVADTNGDGVLAPNDFNAWILAFNTQSPACDQNGDGVCGQNDFNAWVLNSNAGCP
ncbi:MAG: integrin alpha [Planctomycetota bacterium]